MVDDWQDLAEVKWLNLATKHLSSVIRNKPMF